MTRKPSAGADYTNAIYGENRILTQDIPHLMLFCELSDPAVVSFSALIYAEITSLLNQ